MSSLTPERLVELKRVAKEATPGPWETTEFAGAEARSEGELGVFAPRHPSSYKKPDGTWHGIVICRGMDGPTKEANVEYIAAFDPPTVLALLSEIEQLRLERDMHRDEKGERAMTKWREVICPFCWVQAEMRVPMIFDHNTGVWQCTHRAHTAANLEDDDEEAIRKDLIDMYVESQKDREARYKATAYSLSLVGGIRKGGGSSRGRKPKKTIKRVNEKPGTLA